jgi:hypothetical protein
MSDSDDSTAHLSNCELLELWLEKGEEIPDYFSMVVAKDGDFEAIQLLQENTIEVKPLFFEVAKAGGLDATIRYLRDSNPDTDIFDVPIMTDVVLTKKELEYCIKRFSISGDFESIETLKEKGIEINPLLYEIAKVGGLVSMVRTFKF